MPASQYDPTYQPVYGPEGQPVHVAAPNSGLAVSGFVTSLVSLFFFGLLLGPVGAVLSGIALKRDIPKGLRGRGLAIAGLIIGIAVFVFSVLILVLVLVLAASAGVHAHHSVSGIAT